MLRCESCQSLFTVEDYTEETMIAQYTYEINTFICPQCQGQIFSEDEQALGFCPYCGSQAGLEIHTVDIEKPKYIVPFFKTKKVCWDNFTKTMNRTPFIPKELSRLFGGDGGLQIPSPPVTTLIIPA